jgi:hypothetical protein
MRHVAAAVLFTFLLPAGVHAQVVRGDVVDAGTRQPLYGAIITLLDTAGHRVGGAITNDSGRFTVTAPTPGRYRLRANRIGFQSTTSGSFALAAGQTLDQRLVASVVPVMLSSIEVTGKERCTVRPEEGHAAFLVWNEVRKALTATALTNEQRQLNVRIRSFDRDVDPQSGRVMNARSTERAGVSSKPFVALPAAELDRKGYAQLADSASMYYAPDANVLLSDVFTAHHCFRVERSRTKPDSLLGLAFEPARHREVPDVKGVLWVSKATGELRTLEFLYTGLPAEIPRDRFGGDITFRRLATGAWIIDHWILRMPVMAITQHIRMGGVAPSYRSSTLVRVHETGGRVLAASTRDGRVLLPPVR